MLLFLLNGNHDDDEDSDDSNAVRANGLHDLHCDLISAPFPVQVNNEGKGGGGGRKKERKRTQITAHPSASQFTLPQKNNAQNTKSH
jgi:hypothetical protein